MGNEHHAKGAQVFFGYRAVRYRLSAVDTRRDPGRGGTGPRHVGAYRPIRYLRQVPCGERFFGFGHGPALPRQELEGGTAPGLLRHRGRLGQDPAGYPRPLRYRASGESPGVRHPVRPFHGLASFRRLCFPLHQRLRRRGALRHLRPQPGDCGGQIPGQSGDQGRARHGTQPQAGQALLRQLRQASASRQEQL